MYVYYEEAFGVPYPVTVYDIDESEQPLETEAECTAANSLPSDDDQPPF